LRLVSTVQYLRHVRWRICLVSSVTAVFHPKTQPARFVSFNLQKMFIARQTGFQRDRSRPVQPSWSGCTLGIVESMWP
jgi:hypothetical protein